MVPHFVDFLCQGSREEPREEYCATIAANIDSILLYTMSFNSACLFLFELCRRKLMRIICNGVITYESEEQFPVSN